MSKTPSQKDFGRPEPQISAVRPVPPRAFDHGKGGIPTKPLVIEDEHFAHDFEPPIVPDLNYYDRKRRK